MRDRFDTLLVDRPADHVLRVTLNRPQVANAMNTQLGADMHDLFTDLLLDPADIRVVILTGAGEKAFCAGGDLKERNGMTDAAWRKQHVLFEQAIYTMMDCPAPVIAAVNGVAYGGGTELALACDFTYAASTARFALTEVTLGIIPGGGGTQTLARAVGPRRAKEIITSGRPFSAEDALAWGVANSVHSPEDLMPAVLDTASRIAGNAPLAVRQAKRAIDLGYGVDIKTGLGIEIEAYNRLIPTEDRREGVLAFNEKRKANFQAK